MAEILKFAKGLRAEVAEFLFGFGFNFGCAIAEDQLWTVFALIACQSRHLNQILSSLNAFSIRVYPSNPTQLQGNFGYGNPCISHYPTCEFVQSLSS